MIILATAEPVIQSPLVVTLVGVFAAAVVALAAAALKMVIQLSQVTTQLIAIQADIADIKRDPDVMRWSNYGRAVQAFQQTPPNPGVQQ